MILCRVDRHSIGGGLNNGEPRARARLKFTKFSASATYTDLPRVGCAEFPRLVSFTMCRGTSRRASGLLRGEAPRKKTEYEPSERNPWRFDCVITREHERCDQHQPRRDHNQADRCWCGRGPIRRHDISRGDGRKPKRSDVGTEHGIAPSQSDRNMSALPPIATRLVRRIERSRSANGLNRSRGRALRQAPRPT